MFFLRPLACYHLPSRLLSFILLAPILALLIADSCKGQSSITLTFEGLQDEEQVLSYYNGGLGGYGSGPGPNYGITFGPDAIALIAMAFDGTGDFSGNPSGVTAVSFESGPGVVMSVPDGFTTGFSFYYASGANTGVVTVYDGANGTGNILGTVSLGATGTGCNGSVYYYSCWDSQGVSFSGVARSVDFSGATNGIGFDNITIGSQTPGSGNPTPPPTSGPNLTVTPSVSASTSTLTPGPVSRIVTVTNSGQSGSFTASIQGPSGFSIQPTSASIGGSGSSTNLSVLFNTTGQPPGIYTATYTVTPAPLTYLESRSAGGSGMARNIGPRTGTAFPRQSIPGQSTGIYTVMVNGHLMPSIPPVPGLTFNLTGSQTQQQSFSVSEAMNYFIPVAAAYSGQVGPNVTGTISGTTCQAAYQGVCTPENISLSAQVGTLAAGESAIGGLTLTCLTTIPCDNAPLTVSVVINAPAASTLTRTPSVFVPLTPCRVVDTRNASGALGGPSIAAGASRDFALPNGSCGIPNSALAYSLNVTVVPQGPLGYLTIWPTGQSQPLASTLNSDGRIKANAAIVPAGSNGAVSVYGTNTTDVVLDINGYFVPEGSSGALTLYPLPPCRIADTRNSAGALGGPSLAANGSRTFPILTSVCDVPSAAQAYSLNFTAVPSGSLGYLTAWPTGQPQPYVSSLNDPNGTITANAVILPAGTSGSENVFTTDETDLVIDTNGYFAPPGSGGLSLYTMQPCRVLDTRQSPGTPITNLTVNVLASSCGVPSSAQAYVFNATVVPVGSLGFLTLWPDGQSQPLASTLNASDGAITSNLAIVPTSNGSIAAFASQATHLILDISGYFAP
jgi:hypothetical protein